VGRQQYHEYTDEERAALLAMFAASGMTQRAFARSHALPESTLRRWVSASPETRGAIGAQKKAELAALYTAEIEASLAAAGGKRDQASYRDLMIGVGILDDKRTRLAGEATERVEHEVVLDLGDETL